MAARGAGGEPEVPLSVPVSFRFGMNQPRPKPKTQSLVVSASGVPMLGSTQRRRYRVDPQKQLRETVASKAQVTRMKEQMARRAALGAKAEPPPHHVLAAGTTLTFFAHFREAVVESPLEKDRVRHVRIIYFVEDDTISIFEQPQQNSGIPQGKFLRRQRVPVSMREHPHGVAGAGDPAVSGARGVQHSTTARAGPQASLGLTGLAQQAAITRPPSLGGNRTARVEVAAAVPSSDTFLHWSNFRIGTKVAIYGRRFHIAGVDGATRAFYDRAPGVDPQPPNEDEPEDAHTVGRREFMSRESGQDVSVFRGRKSSPVKRYLEAERGNPSAVQTMGRRDKLQQFLDDSDNRLRFLGLWDSSDQVMGERLKLSITYYLGDDEVEIYALYGHNAGRLATREKLYRKSPLPKRAILNDDRNRTIEDDCGEEDYFRPQDLRVGATVHVLGRDILLYDADSFTMDWYKRNQGLDMTGDVIDVSEPEAQAPEIEPPPYDGFGFGTEEDSLGSFFALRVRPPRPDVQKRKDNEGKVLIFNAKLAPREGRRVRLEDQDRKFAILWYMEDDTLMIQERPRRNSGAVAGRFLRRCRIRNPATGDYFRAADFEIGAELTIGGHHFLLESAPELTLKVMEGSADVWVNTDISFVLRNLKRKFLDFSITARRAFRDMDKDKSGYITIDELEAQLAKWGMRVSKQGLLTLFRHYDRSNTGKMSFTDFTAAFTDQDYGADVGGAADRTHQKAEDLDTAGLEDYEAFVEGVKLSNEEETHLTRLLQYFAQEFAARSGEQQMREQFRLMDADKSNSIDRDEFRAALDASFNLRPEDVAILEKRFFPGHLDDLRYEDFMSVLRAELRRTTH